MNAQRHILIVNGDAAARAALGREVAQLGYAVAHAASAEAAALALSRAGRADLALIEAELPDGEGRELVARLRRRGALQPMILLAASAREDDVVGALDAGADDYMVHPVRLGELAARIRAQFRMTAAHEAGDMQVGVLTFRPTARLAFHPYLPQPVRLTEKEAALLARLCRAEGRPVSRETLLREVWGYSPNVTSHTVETHIYRLRRKIEGAPGTPPIVLNDAGGYRLAGPEPAVETRSPPVAWPAAVRRAPALELASAAG